MMNQNYQICNRCILDTSVPSITFDEQGICRYCNDYDAQIKNKQKPKEEFKRELELTIKKIKTQGKGKEYDCIIGLSGGVDSSYVAYLTKKVYGLRPLAVHLDNGWNDELAVKNIENICNLLEIDLFTHVINWEEFKDLQFSFLKASVANAEAPTDHAIFAILYQLAVKYNVKWIIDGVNDATEYVRKDFTAGGYRYDDLKQILGIHRKFGNQKLKTYPKLSIWRKYFLRSVRGIKQFSLLNYVDYNKEKVKEFLTKDLGWKSPGAKHHESLYTKWHQTEYLLKKFGFDKRRLHLSDLILSNQLSRENALLELSQPPMDKLKVKDLVNYVMKKFGISEEEYYKILTENPRNFSDYPNNQKLLNLYASLFRSK